MANCLRHARAPWPRPAAIYGSWEDVSLVQIRIGTKRPAEDSSVAFLLRMRLEDMSADQGAGDMARDRKLQWHACATRSHSQRE